MRRSRSVARRVARKLLKLKEVEKFLEREDLEVLVD